jgi:hypothetical protein
VSQLPAERPAEPAERPAEPAERPAEPAERPAEPGEQGFDLVGGTTPGDVAVRAHDHHLVQAGPGVDPNKPDLTDRASRSCA